MSVADADADADPDSGPSSFRIFLPLDARVTAAAMDPSIPSSFDILIDDSESDSNPDTIGSMRMLLLFLPLLSISFCLPVREDEDELPYTFRFRAISMIDV